MTALETVLAQMRAHRSVRRYTDAAVPDTDIDAAVAAAQCAATSSWVQAYALLQVTDMETRRALVPLVGGQPHVAEAGAFFVVLADTRRHRLVAERNAAPYASNLEAFLVAVIDAALFAQNLVLAFEAQGYGTCYIGGLRNELAAVDRLLELPHGVYPLFGLTVGVAAEDPGLRPRLPVRTVWFKDRYPADTEVMDGIARHDQDAGRYYGDRGAPGRDWSGAIWRKHRVPAREHLAEYYRRKGATFD